MSHHWNRPTVPQGPPPGVALFDPTQFQDKGQAAQGGYGGTAPSSAAFAPPAGTPQYTQAGAQNSWGGQEAGSHGGWSSWKWDANSWGAPQNGADQAPKLSSVTPQVSQNPQQVSGQVPNPSQVPNPGQLPNQGQQGHEQWAQTPHYNQWGQWSQNNQQQTEPGASVSSGQHAQGADQQQLQQPPPQQQQPQPQQQLQQQHEQQYGSWNQQQYWPSQGSNQGTEGSGQWSSDGQWGQQYGQSSYGGQYGQFSQNPGGDSSQSRGGEPSSVQQGYVQNYGQQSFENSTGGQGDQQFHVESQQAAVLESFSNVSVNSQGEFPQPGAGGSQAKGPATVNFFSPESSGNQSDFLQHSDGSNFLQQSDGSSYLQQSGGSDFLQQSGGSDFLQQSANSEFLDQSGNSGSLDCSGRTTSSGQSEKPESSPREVEPIQPPGSFGSLPEDAGLSSRNVPSLFAPPVVATLPVEDQESAPSKTLSVGFNLPETDQSRLKVHTFQRTDSGISNASLSTLNYSVSSTSLEDRDEKQTMEDLTDHLDRVSLGKDGGEGEEKPGEPDFNHSAVGGQGSSAPNGAEEDVQSTNMGDWEFVQKSQSLTSSSSQHSRQSSLDQAVTSALVGPSADGTSAPGEPSPLASAPPPPQGSPRPQGMDTPQQGSLPHPAASVPPPPPPQAMFSPPAASQAALMNRAGVPSTGETRTSSEVFPPVNQPWPAATGSAPPALSSAAPPPPFGMAGSSVSSTMTPGGLDSSRDQPPESLSAGVDVSITETTRALEEMTAGLVSLAPGEKRGDSGEGEDALSPRPGAQDLSGRGRGGKVLPDMFKKPTAPPKAMGSRPAPASAVKEDPSAAPPAPQRRQPGSHSSAFQKVPNSRTKHNMSPATTLWENPDPPTANILLAPAAAPAVAPVLAPVAPFGSSGGQTAASGTAARPSAVSLAGPASATSGAALVASDSVMSLSSNGSSVSLQRFSARDDLPSQSRPNDGRRGRAYPDDFAGGRNEDDARSMNSLDELDAVPDKAEDPRYRRQREYYGAYDPRYDREGFDRRRVRDPNRERYGEDRYDRPRSRHEEERPTSRTEVERPQSRSDVDRDRTRYKYDYERDPYYKDAYRAPGYSYDYYSRGDYYDRYYDQYYGRDNRYARGYQEEMRYRQNAYQERYPQDYWGRQGAYENYDQYSHVSGSRGNTPGPDDSSSRDKTKKGDATPKSQYYYPGRSSRSSSRLGYEEGNSEHYHNASTYSYDPYSYGYSYYGDGYDYSGYQQDYTPGRMTPHKYNIPHVRACFGPGGQLVKVMPNRPADGQPATVELHDVAAMLPDSQTREELREFSGPLLRDDTHKNDVLLFCQKKARACAENINMTDRESAGLIWHLLELMIKQNGTLVGSDLAELLLAGHEPHHEEYEGSGGLRISMSTEDVSAAGLDQTDAVAEYPTVTADRSMVNHGRSRGEIAGRFRHLLLYGRKKDALEWAMKNDLWGHALFLASKMDNRTHANVMTRFANNAMRMNDPLQSLYQLMSGRQPAAVTCICDEGWGDWRPHLAMILSNHTQRTDLDRKCITSLGDTLASKSYLHASHFCYLMAQCKFGTYSKKTSKLVLIGANHYLPVMEFASNEAIQCTEVFEYAQSLGHAGFMIPHFQLYKFLYATRLADYGFPQEALHYCEVISQNVASSPSSYQAVFVRLLYNLSSQLKMHDPQLVQGGQEEGVDPPWLSQLSHTLTCLQDGSIQPASGQATPFGFLGTTASSESGEVTSASVENYGGQQFQGMYGQESAYGQEGYSYTGETGYIPEVPEVPYNQQLQQPQPYGYTQEGNYGAVMATGESTEQTQAPAASEVQAVQQTASGTGAWDASQSTQVPAIQGYSQEHWEGHYAQTYAHQFMMQGGGDSTDGVTPGSQPAGSTQLPPPKSSMVDQGEGGQGSTGFTSQPQPGGQRGSFASTASVTASIEDDGEEDEDDGGEQVVGNSFDYFGVATSNKIIAPPSRFRTSSTSSAGSQRQRTISESSTSSLTAANPKRDAHHSSPKKTQAAPASGPEPQKNQKGWFGGLFSKFSKPKNEMKLPEDKNPSIVWDDQKKRWVNTEEAAEPSMPPPPPPRDADISGPPPPMESSSSAAPPMGNRYSRNKDRGDMGAHNKYVDVLNPGKSNGNSPVPSNIFSILPSASVSTSASSGPAILNPTGPAGASSQSQVPSAVADQSTDLTSAVGELSRSSSMSSLSREVQWLTTQQSEQQPTAPAPGPMLFNPAQFQNSQAPSHTGSVSGGPKFGQRRKYPRQ